MVRWLRKARVVPGKFMETFTFATEIAQYVKKFEGLPPQDILGIEPSELCSVELWLNARMPASSPN
jgi:hypothetical protein